MNIRHYACKFPEQAFAVLKFYICLILFAVLFSCEQTGNKFAVDKIENITKIELNTDSIRITLSKTDSNKWLTDGFKANVRNISNLQKILSGIEVQYPLPKMYETEYSFQRLVNEGINLKIFKKKTIDKDFYIMFTDSIGTLAVADGSKNVYVVDFYGQDIDIQDYIRLEPSFWEDNLALSVKSDEIKSVKLENMYDRDNSFLIHKNGDSIYILTLNGDTALYNSDKVKRYLTYFYGVYYENSLNLSDAEKHKIISSEPLYILSIETVNEPFTCTIYPVDDSGMDDYGNPLIYNRDFFYLSIPQKQLLAKARWLEFDILLEKLKYFTE
ncbi:MAG: hypothetical protein LBG92_04730 [Prevotellaceae bacterium]|jgi:hypothetical protein|nr:hypothetical protein [Prevotellaceae bacterium]